MKLKIAAVIAIIAVGLLAISLGPTGLFALGGEEKALEIGVSLGLSGSTALDNGKIMKGIEMALEEANAKGGINGNMLRLVVEDDKCDGKEGATIISRFANATGIPVIIGGSCSSVTLAMAPIAREKGVVLISPYSSNPALVNEKIFRTISNDLLEAGAMANFAHNELGLKRIGFLYVNNDYGKGLVDEFKARFEEFGGNVVAEETFNVNEKDFRTQLMKLEESSAEAVYVVAYLGEFIPLFKQKKELGFEKQILTITILEQPEILQQAGKEAEGTIFTTIFTDPSPEFREKFHAKYGEEANFWHAIGYDTMNAVVKAIETGGYNEAGIRKALQEMDFRGAANRIKFNEFGDAEYEVAIKQVKEGKFVPYDN